MVKQISCGAIIFKENNERKFLLLLKGNYFEFVKGYIEEGEEEKETVKREIEEETGIIDIQFIDRFREIYSFAYKYKGKLIFREIILYLVKTNNEEVTISFEHDSYKWLSYKEALNIISFKNMKEILTKADNFLDNSLSRFM